MTALRTGDRRPTVVCVGVHILDVHGQPIERIPEGQGGALIDTIKLSAAGTAAGTAVDLAKLGADVITFGSIGTDEIGDFLLDLMRRRGIDPRVVRTTAAQTSSTILPIKPNGDRPAFHVVGANAHLALDDIDPAVIASASVVLLGGPDRMGDFCGEPAHTVLEWARMGGAITALDLLGLVTAKRRDDVLALLPLLDHLVPNEEQLSDLFEDPDPLSAARQAIAHGVGHVVVSLGPDGCLVVDVDGHTHVPGRVVDVVDTTGCGDALTAGYLRGLTLGYSPIAAAELGIAAASLVAGGVSSDAGIVDLEATIAAMRDLPVRPPARSF